MGHKKSVGLAVCKKKGNIAFCLLCDENENNEFILQLRYPLGISYGNSFHE